MIPDITTELQAFSNDYFAKLRETQSPEFVLCVMQATRMRAKIALAHYEKQDVDTLIQKCSEEMAVMTTGLQIEPKEVMTEADAFYDATHAYADTLFKQTEH